MSISLFSPIYPNFTELLNEIEKPLLVNQFNAQEKQVLLILTNNYLVVCDNVYSQSPSHFCKITFSLKSEILFHPSNVPGEEFDLKRPFGIQFEKQQSTQKLTFYCQFPAIVDLWMKELEKKINQRNFHKLFKAKKKIGKGAFATVYLAQRLRDKKMVAVKAFSKQKQYSGDKGRQSLENEIKLMRSIHHPNIMSLEGIYETQNSIYVILEYLEGVQLNEILKSEKVLTPTQKAIILKNLLKGLDHLNSLKIIHRDLKPENIMFKKLDSYDLAICDFGLATYAHQQKYLFVRCGTPGFVAPEIINIKDMSTKSQTISDVFSAGLIFHYLLFGHSIFSGKKYNQILNQNRQCDFDFTLEKYRLIPQKALDLLVRMLQKDPKKRISAKSALAHNYFEQEMDIQCQNRYPFKQISYNSYMDGIKNIQCQQTPSVLSSKKPYGGTNYNMAIQGTQNAKNRRLYM